MSELEGKTAIVTGAARGTGAAIAKRFVELGARVLLGDVREEEGEEVAEALGEGARFLRQDVTRAEDWAASVEAACAWGEGVDILVNNAAVLHLGTLENTPEDVFRHVLEVNTVGPFLGLRAVAPVMRRRGGGSVVNVGSIDSLLGMNGILAYSSSKWGLRGLSKSASLELGRDGIRVNSVCPGGIETDAIKRYFDHYPEIREKTVGTHAMRRLGRPEEIADAVVYLASDRSSFVTGHALWVDGGIAVNSHMI